MLSCREIGGIWTVLCIIIQLNEPVHKFSTPVFIREQTLLSCFALYLEFVDNIINFQVQYNILARLQFAWTLRTPQMVREINLLVTGWPSVFNWPLWISNDHWMPFSRESCFHCCVQGFKSTSLSASSLMKLLLNMIH